MAAKGKLRGRGVKAAGAALFCAVLLLSGCGGKGFKVAIESGGSEEKNPALAAEQAPFVSETTRKLPEMTAEEHERMGDGLLARGNLYLAYVNYEKALRLKPENPGLEYKKGLALLLGERNEDAIRQFEALLKKDPKFDLAHEGLGRAYFQTGDLMQAERHFRKAIALNHRLWKSYNYLGAIADKRGDFEQAILEYTSAIAIAPNEGFLYNNLGVSCLTAGHYEAAVDAFAKAIRRNFRESKVFNNLGLAYGHLGRFEEAFEAFRMGGGEAHAHNNIGCVYLEKGLYAEAVKSFERAIALEPEYYTRAAENLKRAKALALTQ